MSLGKNKRKLLEKKALSMSKKWMAASAKVAKKKLFMRDLKMTPTRCSNQSGAAMSAKRLVVWLWKVLAASRSKYFPRSTFFVLRMRNNVYAIAGKNYLERRRSLRSYKLEMMEM